MKLLTWLWSFIPVSSRVWVIIIGVVIGLILLGAFIYKIQKWGYDRCETKYEMAIVDLKDSSRKEILEAEKQYGKIKTKIIRVKGDNGFAGPRTELAIDSMPQPVGR